MSTVTINVTITAAELWSAILGSGWDTYEWWHTYTYADGSDWDTPGQITVAIDNPDLPGHTWATLGVDDLVAAWNALVADGHRDACTGLPFTVDDVDACVGDAVMQHATLGKVVYG